MISHLIPPEILLRVFKQLDSKEVVNVMRVRKEWSEIIDEHKALWRRLILPEPKQDGWNASIVELFNRKSDKKLTEVFAMVDLASEQRFIEALEESKKSLRSLFLIQDSNMSQLEECYSKLPYLKYFRVVNLSWRSSTVLVLPELKPVQDDHDSVRLEVFWGHDFMDLTKSGPNILVNVKSLQITHWLDVEDWRSLLEKSCCNLRDLQMVMFGTNEEGYSPMEFPNLQVLDLQFANNSAEFPSWMIIPSSATLVIRRERLLSRLPSISRLWLSDLSLMHGLTKELPQLTELRFQPELNRGPLRDYPMGTFISILSERKANAEAEMEVNGEKFIHLKKLVLPSKMIEDHSSQLSGLVGEVVGLETVSQVIGVVI